MIPQRMEKTVAMPVPNAADVAPEPVTHEQVVQWFVAMRDEVRSAPWAPLVDFDGVDAIDSLLSPIYLAVLNAARQGQWPQGPARRSLVNRAREWAYRQKMAYRVWRESHYSTRVEPADVVLWTRDISHTVTLVPVAFALDGMGIGCRLLACQPIIFETLRHRYPNPIYTMRAWPSALRRAKREGLRRARQLSECGTWNVPPLGQVPNEVLESTVRQTVTDFLPLVAEAVANAHAVVDFLKPKVLIAGNDLTLEGRVACRVGAMRSVTTGVFMHGNITGNALQPLRFADRVFVYGPAHRQQLIQQGIAPERIMVCGAPHLDSCPRQTRQPHSLLQARLGLKPGEPWILVATSGPGHQISHRHHRIVIENLVRLCKAFPDVHVVVKLHRKDRLEYYQRGLADCAATKLTIVSVDAYGFPRDFFDWLQGCSVVLTGGSTAAVDAMLMDVPVVTMDFCDEIHDVDFIDLGATTHTRTPDELIQRVRAILEVGGDDPGVHERAKAYLQRAFFALDGRSAARGAEAIAEMRSLPPSDPAALGAVLP